MKIRIKSKSSNALMGQGGCAGDEVQTWATPDQLDRDAANLSVAPVPDTRIAPAPPFDNDMLPLTTTRPLEEFVSGWWIVPMIALAMILYALMIFALVG